MEKSVFWHNLGLRPDTAPFHYGSVSVTFHVMGIARHVVVEEDVEKQIALYVGVAKLLHNPIPGAEGGDVFTSLTLAPTAQGVYQTLRYAYRNSELDYDSRGSKLPTLGPEVTNAYPWLPEQVAVTIGHPLVASNILFNETPLQAVDPLRQTGTKEKGI